MVLLEKRIGNKENPLEIREMRKELNLRFERLNVKSECNRESDDADDQALFMSQFKDKGCSVGIFFIKSLMHSQKRGSEMMV